MFKKLLIFIFKAIMVALTALEIAVVLSHYEEKDKFITKIMNKLFHHSSAESFISSDPTLFDWEEELKNYEK